MKTTPLLLAAIVLLGVLAVNPAEAVPAGATGGSGGSVCDHYYHASVAQINGVISAGDIELWAGTEACGYANSPTQVMTWTYRISGPAITAFLTTATVAPTSFSGCTATTPNVAQDLFLSGSSWSGFGTITMTSNECRGVYLVTVTLFSALMAPLAQTRIYVPVNIVHTGHASYQFLCAATGTTTSATDPDTSTCNAPTLNTVQSGSVGVDILDDTTDDGQLTTPMTNVSTMIGNQTITIPDSFNVTTQNGNLVGGLPAYSFGLLLFWIIALLFFAYQAWWFSLGFSIPGLLEVLFPAAIPEDFTVWFVFCLLGVLAEVAANRFQWGYYKNRNQTRS